MTIRPLYRASHNNNITIVWLSHIHIWLYTYGCLYIITFMSSYIVTIKLCIL